LDRVHVGEHVAGSRASPFVREEQDGVFNSGQMKEEFTHAEMEPALRGVAHHQAGDREREHALKTWTLIFCSVQWNIGENETTEGSFIWRKSPSTCHWER